MGQEIRFKAIVKQFKTIINHVFCNNTLTLHFSIKLSAADLESGITNILYKSLVDRI